MMLLHFLCKNLSPVAWLGGVNGPADPDVSLDRALWGAWGSPSQPGGHTRAGKGTNTGGFAEFKERPKVRESKG